MIPAPSSTLPVPSNPRKRIRHRCDELADISDTTPDKPRIAFRDRPRARKVRYIRATRTRSTHQEDSRSRDDDAMKQMRAQFIGEVSAIFVTKSDCMNQRSHTPCAMRFPWPYRQLSTRRRTKTSRLARAIVFAVVAMHVIWIIALLFYRVR